jgi:hypothetical protein
MTSEEIAYKIRTKYSYDVRNTNVLSCTKGGTFLKDGKKFVSHERDIDTHKQQNESSDFEKPTKKTRKRKSNEDTIPVPIHMKPEKKEIKHKRKQAKKKEDISVPEILIDEIVPKELETKTPKKQQKKQKKIKEKSGNQTSQKPITNDKSNMSPNKITRKNRLMEISV